MMVRINLLPTKRRTSAGGQAWRIVALVIALFFVELIALYVIYSGVSTEHTELQDQISVQQNDINNLERQVDRLPQLEQDIQMLQAREQALGELTGYRFGPQHVLDELKRILSVVRSRNALKRAKSDGWNIGWESENVVLVQFVEEEEGMVSVIGLARSLEDVSEFWKRMRTSALFKNVRLRIVREKFFGNINLQVQEFALTANVNFYYQTKDILAMNPDDEEGEDASEAPGQEP